MSKTIGIPMVLDTRGAETWGTHRVSIDFGGVLDLRSPDPLGSAKISGDPRKDPRRIQKIVD